MSPGRWRRPLTLLAAGLLVASLAVPARAAYPAKVAVNTTAFGVSCLGFEDSYPEKMTAAAKAALNRLGHTSTSMTGAGFTRASFLSSVSTQWSVYVHSHGDYYWHAGDARRYSGFREDSGDCAQSVIYSKDIAARRGGMQSNLVFISTCHNGEANTTLPAAFAIAKTKSLTSLGSGPEFYVSYLGDAWDNDEWRFEQAFWDALGPGNGVGQAFDIAAAQGFSHALEADWWGTYVWSGHPGLLATCARCS